MVADVMKTIAGKEELPAKEVFKNIKWMPEMPAGRLLRVMDMGYARSLGVGCDHCHVPGKWASDEKSEKVVARQMAQMVQTINTDLLAKVTGLDNEKAIVNCTTCHRGQVKPALNLPGPAGAGPR